MTTTFLTRAKFFGRGLTYTVAWLGSVACAGEQFKASHTQGSGGEVNEVGEGGTSGGTAAAGGTSTATTDTGCESARISPADYLVELCIPEGTFTMGSESANLTGAGYFSHTTTHEVTLSAFLIDAYEVTVARYRACVEASVCDAVSTETDAGCTYTESAESSENLPISCVTYEQAKVFCEWDEGRRLPTEAEWERTAAGASANVYPWGDTFTCDNAVLGSTASCEYTGPEPVGSHPTGASDEGAYDMSGNVAEWVSDYAAAYTSDPVTNPTGPSTGTYRLKRGGSYKSLSKEGQTFVRVSSSATTVGPNGIRCARSVQ